MAFFLLLEQGAHIFILYWAPSRMKLALAGCLACFSEDQQLGLCPSEGDWWDSALETLNSLRKKKNFHQLRSSPVKWCAFSPFTLEKHLQGSGPSHARWISHWF